MKKATYGWIVTKDFIGHEKHKRTGTSGPRNISDEILRRLEAGEGQRWRCRDDDGELYYEGLMLGEGPEGGFEPLDDFCQPDAGCTSIEWCEDGEWEPL